MPKGKRRAVGSDMERLDSIFGNAQGGTDGIDWWDWFGGTAEARAKLRERVKFHVERLQLERKAKPLDAWSCQGCGVNVRETLHVESDRQVWCFHCAQALR